MFEIDWYLYVISLYYFFGIGYFVYIVVTNKGGGRFAENARTECEAFVYLNTHF